MTAEGMPIFTSSWFARLPDDHARIGISRGVPRGQKAGFRLYRRLAPGDYFNRVTVAEYDRLYRQQLEVLDPHQVVGELRELAAGLKPTLLCFEPAAIDDDRWCHRAMVSAWLFETLGLVVLEVGLEHPGYGRHHPKLHSSLRG